MSAPPRLTIPSLRFSAAGICFARSLYEILYEETENGELMEMERIYLCPAEGRFGCQVPKGVWHTVEVIEPSVIYEAKEGKYGEDGSEVPLSSGVL